MNLKDFEILFIPEQNRAFRFAVSILQDEDLAKDVTQDVYSKLWIKRDSLIGIESPKALLLKMIKNACLDHIKVSKNRKNKLKIIHSSKSVRSQEQIYEHAEEAGILLKLIKKLPEQQRMIVHLKDVEGFEMNEIAEYLEINVNAVRVNLSRARKYLRNELLKIRSYEFTGS